MHNNIVVPENEQIPIKQKIAYGIGGLSEFFIANLVLGLSIPIFAVGMKLDPFILGLVMAGTKVISAFADPFVGIISDRSRYKWGRRKPFILVFGILAALLLPFVWLVPNVSDNLKFIYIFVILSVYFFFHSFYKVPYDALGYELTPNYDERTKVFAWKNYVAMIGVFSASWFYWFTLRPVFGNEMNGAAVLGVIGGALIIIGAITVTRGTHEIGERQELHMDENKISIKEALITTFSNKSFLYIQGAILVVALATGIDATIGSYLHIHYTSSGDKDLASLIAGVGGTISTLSIFVALPLAVWISTRWGKREASMFGMGVMLISAVATPWLLNPVFPWLAIILWVLNTFGSQCSNVIYGSMVADVCDEDELKTGRRREGSYAAASSFLFKFVQVFVLILSGAMPRIAGYVDTSIAPSLEQLEFMKVIVYSTNIVGVSIAIYFLYFYPLTRIRCAEIKKQLDERHLELSHESTSTEN